MVVPAHPRVWYFVTVSVVVLCLERPESSDEPGLLVLWSITTHTPLMWGKRGAVYDSLTDDFGWSPQYAATAVDQAIATGSSALAYEVGGPADRGPAWFSYDDLRPMRFRHGRIERDQIATLCRRLDGVTVQDREVDKVAPEPAAPSDAADVDGTAPPRDGPGLSHAVPSPPPSRPTPAFVQPPPRASDQTVNGIVIARRVVALAEQFDYDLDEISRVVIDPEATWPSRGQKGTVHLRGEIAAVTAAETGDIVAITTRQRAQRERQMPRDGAMPRMSGGSGTRMPTDFDELMRRARAAGLDVTRDRRHYLLRSGASRGQVTIPRSASDHRAVKNAVTTIRHELGVDLTAPS